MPSRSEARNSAVGESDGVGVCVGVGGGVGVAAAVALAAGLVGGVGVNVGVAVAPGVFAGVGVRVGVAARAAAVVDVSSGWPQADNSKVTPRQSRSHREIFPMTPSIDEPRLPGKTFPRHNAGTDHPPSLAPSEGTAIISTCAGILHVEQDSGRLTARL